MTPKQQINADIKLARGELRDAKAASRTTIRRVADIEKDIAKMQKQREKL